MLAKSMVWCIRNIFLDTYNMKIELILLYIYIFFLVRKKGKPRYRDQSLLYFIFELCMNYFIDLFG